MNKAILVILMTFPFLSSIHAQLKIGRNPTILQSNANLQIESINSNHLIVTRDSSFMGIGTLTPTNPLHIVANSNPIRLQGLQSGNSISDSILTTDANGVVRRVSANRFNNLSNPEPWFSVSTGMGATTNTENIYHQGKIGLGTSNPWGKLQLDGSSVSGLRATIFGLNTGTTSEIIFSRGGLSKGLAAIAGYDNGFFGGGLALFTKRQNGIDDFPASAIQTMTLDWNGNVGIGSTSPIYKLTISDENPNDATRIYVTNRSNTANSSTDVVTQNEIGVNCVMGINASTSNSANLNTGVSGTSSFVKTTAGPLYIMAGGAGVYLSQGSTSWTSNSDKRIKRNILKLDNGLSKLITLSGYSYNYVSDKENEPKRVGLLAQEVQEVLPEAISINNDGILGVRYTELTPLVIEAIKDLKKEVDKKNLEIEAQKLLINQLINEIESIKTKLK